MRMTWVGLAATVALAACQGPAEVHADKGYVRLAAAPGRPAAAYFTLHGGEKDMTLVSTRSALAIKSEMHETMQTGGMSHMMPLDNVPLPAKGELVFAPGGRHVMLFDLPATVKPGTMVPLTFTLNDGRRIEYSAPAIAAGDPPPAG